MTSNEFDMAYGVDDAITLPLRAQPLMEGFAWHGWAGMTDVGWMQLTCGPTRHAAMPELMGMTHRKSWVSEPSEEEREWWLKE